MRSLALGGIALLLLTTTVFGGTIERACLKAERRGSLALCGCIQDAANLTLTARDQRLAATFFADPEKAQRIRMSDSRDHSEFWRRYENFGMTAEKFCGR